MTGELEVGDGAGVGEDLEVGDGMDLHGTEGACVEEEVISKDEQRRRWPLRRTAKPLAGGDPFRRPDLGFACDWRRGEEASERGSGRWGRRQ
jgi:hypothetical protein